MGLHARLIATPSGPLEVFERTGSARAAALVLLHGIQGTAEAWTGVMPFLSTDLTLVAPNMRGRGRSFTPMQPAEYNLTAFAQDLKAVVDQCCADYSAVYLVGWSMGVLITLEYARLYRLNHFAAVILASGTACPGTEAIWFKERDPDKIAIEAQLRAQALNLTSFATPVAVAGAWLAARHADYRELLGHIERPILIIHGTTDNECPFSHGQYIADNLPGATLYAWEDGPHNLMAADPVRFAAAVSGFIQTP